MNIDVKDRWSWCLVIWWYDVSLSFWFQSRAIFIMCEIHLLNFLLPGWNKPHSEFCKALCTYCFETIQTYFYKFYKSSSNFFFFDKIHFIFQVWQTFIAAAWSREVNFFHIWTTSHRRMSHHGRMDRVHGIFGMGCGVEHLGG